MNAREEVKEFSEKSRRLAMIRGRVDVSDGEGGFGGGGGESSG